MDRSCVGKFDRSRLGESEPIWATTAVEDGVHDADDSSPMKTRIVPQMQCTIPFWWTLVRLENRKDFEPVLDCLSGRWYEISIGTYGTLELSIEKRMHNLFCIIWRGKADSPKGDMSKWSVFSIQASIAKCFDSDNYDAADDDQP